MDLYQGTPQTGKNTLDWTGIPAGEKVNRAFSSSQLRIIPIPLPAVLRLGSIVHDQ